VHGEVVRQSLDLTNWEAAHKKAREWEVCGMKQSVALKDAYDRFIAQHEANGSADNTVAKHRRRPAGRHGHNHPTHMFPAHESKLLTFLMPCAD
jgi:hypothetical protein